MDRNEIRKLIHKHIKLNRTIQTNRGLIEINIKRIGEGGTAIVYSSKDREFAIKILAEDCYRRKSQIYLRFEQEFLNLAELSNEEDFIAQIYEFDFITVRDKDRTFKFPFILMKRYQGNLSDIRKDIKNPSIKEVEKFIADLVRLIGGIHEKGIVHRDLKPENIFIDESGKFVLGDFGIASFDEELYQKLVKTEKSDRLANYKFSAPEQFEKGAKAFSTVDIFAIGQIINWYITGETIQGIRSHKLSSILGPQWHYLDRVVEILIQRDPAKRPQSVVDFNSILELERKNNNHNWLYESNPFYRELTDLIKRWEHASILPSGAQAEFIIMGSDFEKVSTEKTLFLLLVILLDSEDSDFIEFTEGFDFERLAEYTNDDIFDGFELSFNRMALDEYMFYFRYYRGDRLEAETDSFDIYADNRMYNCIYSEVYIKESKIKYKILLWNDTGLQYRLVRKVI